MSVNVLIAWCVGVSFSVCFASFASCYIFWPIVSIKTDGQLRSLSGVMKNTKCKPYFCFVMGCLGGSLFLATGMESLNEESVVHGDLVLLLSFGMYTCFLGVVNYDIAYNKRIHLSFVFVLIVLGYLFSNLVLKFAHSGSGSNNWNDVASAAYNIFTSAFLVCFLYNVYIHSQGLTDYHTVQTWFEIVWVLSLIFMLCVYAFDGDSDEKVLHSNGL